MSTTESIHDALCITLSTRPGTDLASKMLFKEPEIKDLIIKEVTAGKINGVAYEVGQNEFKDGRKSDVIYVLPGGKHTVNSPPVVIEIQQTVDISFMKRLTRYCLNIHDITKVEPEVIVFVIKGFASKAFAQENLNQPEENMPYYTPKKYVWAKTCRFYSLDSISSNTTNENVMAPIEALTYFLGNQKKSLFGLEKYEDLELAKIYQIAARSFEPFTTKEEANHDHTLEVMRNTGDQFKRIYDCADQLKQSKDNGIIIRKIKRYADDGVQYTAKKIKMVENDENGETITPIENVPTADFAFVEKQRELQLGRFSWEECFSQGRMENLFSRYRTHLSLKVAYHKERL